MSSACVKTVLLCSEVWGDQELNCSMPPMFLDDTIHLSFEIQTVGNIKGLFDVVDILHVYDSDVGYSQRIKLEPA